MTGRRKSRKFTPREYVAPEPEPRCELVLRRSYVYDRSGRHLTGRLVRRDRGGWATMKTAFETHRIRTTKIIRPARLDTSEFAPRRSAV